MTTSSDDDPTTLVPPPPPSSNSRNNDHNNSSRRMVYLRRKSVLIPILLSALWLLSDDETTTNNNTAAGHHHHHLAVWTALHRHPPCLRVYRVLLELNLMIWCIALSLVVWNTTIGTKMIGHLLFLPYDHNTTKDCRVGYTESSHGMYRPITQQEQQDDDNEEEDQQDEDTADQQPQPQQQDVVVYRIDSTEDDYINNNNNNIDNNNDNDDNDVNVNTSISLDDDDDDNNNNNNNVDDGTTDQDQQPNPSSSSSTIIHDMIVMPPSASSVVHVAIDSLIAILISLFLFTISSAEGGRYVDGMARIHTFQYIALVAAPLFPLLTFVIGIIKCIIPWNNTTSSSDNTIRNGRKSQWMILLRTPSAPLYNVTFRDGLIGDILTSSVRPLQDITFTIVYLVSGLQGWWQQTYDWDTAASTEAMKHLPLETNWILHTFILPMCMVSPLWWRFLQCLRQSYEYKKRWPYLGNALKYFIAAEVAVFGVYMQSAQQSIWWLSAFVIATLYQIWWDVFMDWNLIDVEWEENVRLQDIPQRLFYAVVPGMQQQKEEQSYFERMRTMNNPRRQQHHGNRSSLYLPIPVRIRLRSTRIYSVTWLYWCIFGINILLRFCWTLSFLPPHYLNRAGVLSETFVESHLADILNPTIASAEIIRRMLWGLLRVEWEAIQVGRKEPRLKGAWRDNNDNKSRRRNSDDNDDGDDDDLEMKIMEMEETLYDDDMMRMMITTTTTTTSSSSSSPSWVLPKQQRRRMNEMTQIQIVSELCIYATIFTGLGLLAAAHRETL